ncbi:MAG: NAD-dependent DNA ligase LigA [Bacteroidales bacterium]|nr:NAD-dependent DNA ligase LigA [Bacteroidales bacterium]
MTKVLEIKDLIERLNKYRDSYYNHNISLITDREYDNLFDRLIELENKTGLILSNSPTQSVGYSVASKLKKVKHNHPLLSLNKTTEVEEFSNFFKNKKWLMMAKLDGLTCSVLYKDGKLVRAETRGDGETGEDITNNAKMFLNLPLMIPFSGELVVDGECIITTEDFEKINKPLVAKAEKDGVIAGLKEDALKKYVKQHSYANPRNLVSGTVRQLNNEIVKERNVKFVAWKLYSANEYSDSHIQRLLDLKNLGFDVVPHESFNSDLNDSSKSICEYYIEKIKNECTNLQLPIDGMVGMFDSVSYGESLGKTGHHPRHSLAFKFYQEEIEAQLIDIEWSTSRTGLVNPVAILEPVEIDGTIVSRATLNNVSIIEELELGIGDTVTVIKANQIIPRITQNLTRTNMYKIPSVCPACGQPTKIRDNNGRKMLYCNNKYCKSIIHDKISNFATRDAMNIVGISEERLRYLLDKGYVTNFSSLYKLKEYRDLIIREKGFGESSVDNLINAIEQSRVCTLQNVIVAIGIPNIGKAAARTIANFCLEKAQYENINPLKVLVYLATTENQDWSILPDIGITTSEIINQYIKENSAEILNLSAELNIKTTKEEIVKKLAGKTFCITGKLNEFDNRKELVYDIESNGGVVVSSVTKKTQYLITNDKTSGSSKNIAAQKFGVKIITELEYIMGKL